MNRLERLYAITEAIRRAAPRPLSAARLAETFEVSRRTIERDLAALRAAGVPLYAERGRTGGHLGVDRPGNVLVALSTAEISALLIALAAAGDDMPFAESGALATRRLLESLPSTTRPAVDELRSRVRTKTGDGPPVGKRIRHTVEQAVRRSVVVNIDYEDAHGTRTSRSVEAVGFYDGPDGWYLIGWCLLRDGRRIFRLDRIQSARLTRRSIGVRNVDETLGWIPHDTATP